MDNKIGNSMTYVYVRKGGDQFGGDPKTMTKSTLVARFMFVPSFSSSAFFPTYVEMLCPTATQDPIGTSPLKRGKLPSKASKLMLPTWSSVTPRASKTGTKREKKKERKKSIYFILYFSTKEEGGESEKSYRYPRNTTLLLLAQWECRVSLPFDQTEG